MKYSFTLALIVFFISAISAQNLITKEVEIGLSFPTGESVSKVFDAGFSGAAALNFNISENVHLGPSFQYKFYRNNPEMYVKDGLEIIIFKVVGGFKLVEKNDFKLHLITSVGYSKYFNRLKFKVPNQIVQRIEIFEGETFMWDLGIKALYKHVYLKFDFQRLVDVPTYDSDLVEEIEQEYQQFQVFKITNNPLKMSALTLSIGYSW